MYVYCIFLCAHVCMCIVYFCVHMYVCVYFCVHVYSLLFERRILITSRRLGRLTACIHAAAALIYPLHWQVYLSIIFFNILTTPYDME